MGSGPAISLAKIEETAPALVDLYRNAGVSNGQDQLGPMNAVIDHYLDSGAQAPALVVFQTDGGPLSKHAAERHLCKAARLPLFWQFIGFGNKRSSQFDFLRRLDELAVAAQRPVDNAGFFHAGPDPRRVPDGELYDRLVAEFRQWLAAARAHGITQ